MAASISGAQRPVLGLDVHEGDGHGGGGRYHGPVEGARAAAACAAAASGGAARGSVTVMVVP